MSSASSPSGLRGLWSRLWSLPCPTAWAAGDWIEAKRGEGSTVCGWVEAVSYNATEVRTEAGDVVILSSRWLADAIVVNRSRPERRSRSTVEIALPSDAPTERCTKLLINALRALAEGPQRAPIEREYKVEIVRIGADGVTYAVHFWHDPTKSGVGAIRHHVARRLLRHLRLAGIPVAAERAEIVHRPKAEHPGLRSGRIVPIEVLASLDLFSGVDEAVLGPLAEKMEIVRIAPGQRVLLQGDDSTEMYFVAEGLLQVTVEQNGARADVSLLQPGDYFGEMSLLTNAPRTATVHAVVSGVIFSLSRSAMQAVVEAHPSILKVLSGNLAIRSLERDRSILKAAALQGTGDVVVAEPESGARLLEKMGKVFFEFDEMVVPDPNVPPPPA